MAMFKKVLIANRGEIALRVIRACKEMGISTVAVYSKADEHSLHVKMADESVCIGPPQAKLSYLNVASLMSAADVTRVDAIHPGYGFLSENSNFARVCEQCNITFIGPGPEQIAAMGDKVAARAAAEKAGVPMLPGTGLLPTVEQALTEAERIGYPVMLKATAGGGGRGIQIIYAPAQLKTAYERVKTEAAAAFGNGACYLEKFCEHPRHVEVQVACDSHGNMVHLGERDCTVQRRHQKLVEEAPSPVVDDDLRSRMGEAALRLCKQVGYRNVGTVEFLVDENKNFYFMEMNTRIQVEHPVTEFITGLDLVKLQLLIAAGEKLPITQKDVQFRGHAIECRINAEDPVRMLPSPGLITAYHPPGGFGVRVDSFAYQQYKVPPFYDSMIGKLICWGATREEAIQKMAQALDEYVIAGIQTNISFQRKIVLHERFRSLKYDTHFLEQFMSQ